MDANTHTGSDAERHNVETLTGSTPPGAGHADAPILALVERICAESEVERGLWRQDPELPDDDPHQVGWIVQARAATDRLNASISELSELRSATLAGTAAKALALAENSAMFERLCDPEANLLRSLLRETLHLQNAPRPAPVIPRSSIHALGIEVSRLWACRERVERQCNEPRNKRYPTIFENQIRLIDERIDVIEKQVSFASAETAADAMFQIAFALDQVDVLSDLDAEDEDSTVTERRIGRMLVSIFDFIASGSGLSMVDVGADAYMKYAYKKLRRDLSRTDEENVSLQDAQRVDTHIEADQQAAA